MTRVPPHQPLLHDDRGSTTTTQPLTTFTADKAQGGRAYTSEASFDTNMVIILGALLCALICALGLNSIVRCALRCTGRLTSSDHPHHHQAGVASIGAVGFRGLKRSTIRQIPATIYHDNPSGRKSNSEFISTDCIICLGEFVGGEKIRVLPKCKHGFHMRCIDTWLLSHSSCPTCRQPVPVLASEWVGSGGALMAVGGDGGGGGQNQLANEVVDVRVEAN